MPFFICSPPDPNRIVLIDLGLGQANSVGQIIGFFFGELG
jgi:hypothetical protein